MLQEQKTVLTVAIDTLMSARENLDKCIDKLIADLESVRIDIGQELITMDGQLRRDLLHMQLEDSE